MVRLAQFAASSLDHEVMAWLRPADRGELLLIQQDILLRFRDCAGTASPTFSLSPNCDP